MIRQLARIADLALHPVEMRRAYVGQGPDFSVSVLDDFLDFVAGGGESTWSGASVTKATASKFAAVWACHNVISGSLAQMPLHVQRVDADGSKHRLRDHYLSPLLGYQVNPYMTPFRFKQLMQTWLLIDGNAYAHLEINGRGQVTALWPWHYNHVSVDFENQEWGPVYVYRTDKGEELRAPWSDILHLRGLGTDGYFGLSPITHHRQTIGLGLAQQEYQARFYGNSAIPGGALEFPMAFQNKRDVVDRIRKSWQETHGTLSNVAKVAILEEGIKFHEISPMKMVDAQFVESAQFTLDDVCRIYNVPPHKIFELTRSTNNNIEWQGMEWLGDGLGPWLVNWEEEMERILLSNREAETIQIRFERNALMRMDAAARAKYFTAAIGSGWMSPNDVGRVEDINPYPGGDTRYMPANLVPIGTVPKKVESKEEPVPVIKEAEED